MFQIIVFERRTGKCLAGPNAPTAENLKSWLQKNPTFEVVRPGTLGSTKPNAPTKKPEPQKIQTTLNFEKINKKSTAHSPTTQTTTELKQIKSPKEPKRSPSIRSFLVSKPSTPTAADTTKPSTLTPKSAETKKSTKPTLNRSRSSTEKVIFLYMIIITTIRFIYVVVC